MGPDAPRPVAGLCAGATAPLTGGLVRRALGPLPPMLTQCLTQLITSALVIAAPGDSDLVDVVVAMACGDFFLAGMTGRRCWWWTAPGRMVAAAVTRMAARRGR